MPKQGLGEARSTVMHTVPAGATHPARLGRPLAIGVLIASHFQQHARADVARQRVPVARHASVGVGGWRQRVDGAALCLGAPAVPRVGGWAGWEVRWL